MMKFISIKPNHCPILLKLKTKRFSRSKPEQRQKKLNKIDKGRTEILLFKRQQRMLKKRKEFESN